MFPICVHNNSILILVLINSLIVKRAKEHNLPSGWRGAEGSRCSSEKLNQTPPDLGVDRE